MPRAIFRWRWTAHLLAGERACLTAAAGGPRAREPQMLHGRAPLDRVHRKGGVIVRPVNLREGQHWLGGAGCPQATHTLAVLPPGVPSWSVEHRESRRADGERR